MIDWLPWRRSDRSKDRRREPRKRRAHPVRAIEGHCLDMIIEAARDVHPNEFAGALRAEDGVITEIVIVPGTVSGAAHAILRVNELPIDRSIVGIAHSHPSPVARPSRADINLFGKFGHTHIIVAHPYNRDTWLAWDHRGERIQLDVL